MPTSKFWPNYTQQPATALAPDIAPSPSCRPSCTNSPEIILDAPPDALVPAIADADYFPQAQVTLAGNTATVTQSHGAGLALAFFHVDNTANATGVKLDGATAKFVQGNATNPRIVAAWIPTTGAAIGRVWEVTFDATSGTVQGETCTIQNVSGDPTQIVLQAWGNAAQIAADSINVQGGGLAVAFLAQVNGNTGAFDGATTVLNAYPFFITSATQSYTPALNGPSGASGFEWAVFAFAPAVSTASTVSADGSASGSGTATAEGVTVAQATGSASGSGSAAATGAAQSSASGSAAGSGAGSAGGTAVAQASGQASGSSSGPNLVVNGDGNSTTGWTVSGSGASLSLVASALRLSMDASGVAGFAYQAVGVEVGKVCRLSVDFVSANGSGGYVAVGDAPGGSAYGFLSVAPGAMPTTQTLEFVPTSTPIYVSLEHNSSTSVFVDYDNISVRAATQAVGAAVNTVSGQGSGSGAGSAVGVGAAVASGQGAGVGSGMAAGVGFSIASATGSASGAGSASAGGQSQASATGSASGSGGGAAQGRTIAQSSGSSAGSGSAAAGGVAVTAASGAASGTGSASGISPGTAVQSATGSAAGAGSASGSGRAVAQASASASGSGTAQSQGIAVASNTGSAGGSGTGSGTAVAIAAASGQASGSGAAGGAGARIANSSGSAAGTGQGAGSGAGTVAATGSASGVGGSNVIDATALFAGSGNASGSGGASAQGRSQASANGSASGVGNGLADMAATKSASGSASGSGGASGNVVQISVALPTKDTFRRAANDSFTARRDGTFGGSRESRFKGWRRE